MERTKIILSKTASDIHSNNCFFRVLRLVCLFYSVFAELSRRLNPTMASCHLCQSKELFTFKAHNKCNVKRKNSVSSLMAD